AGFSDAHGGREVAPSCSRVSRASSTPMTQLRVLTDNHDGQLGTSLSRLLHPATIANVSRSKPILAYDFLHSIGPPDLDRDRGTARGHSRAALQRAVEYEAHRLPRRPTRSWRARTSRVRER